MPRSLHLHTEIYPNLKSISELFKMYMKSLDSFILASRDNTGSRVQPDTRLSPPLRRQSSFSSTASHKCLWDIAAAWLAVIFSRHNRFSETHSHLQLSYHITDRLLAAGNKSSVQISCMLIRNMYIMTMRVPNLKMFLFHTILTPNADINSSFCIFLINYPNISVLWIQNHFFLPLVDQKYRS